MGTLRQQAKTSVCAKYKPRCQRQPCPGTHQTFIYNKNVLYHMSAQEARDVIKKVHNLLEKTIEAGAGQLHRLHELHAALAHHDQKNLHVKEAVASTKRMKKPATNLKKTVEELRSEIAELILVLDKYEGTEGFIHYFKKWNTELEISVNQLLHDLYGGSKCVQELLNDAEKILSKKSGSINKILPSQNKIVSAMKDLEKQNGTIQSVLKHLGKAVHAIEKRR